MKTRLTKPLPALVLALVLFSSVVTYAAWTTPRTWSIGEVVTAAMLNTHVRDNLNELRVGGLAISGQAANEIVYGSTTTQLTTLATANNGTLITSGAGVPSISSTLPNAVQDNITRLGTVTTGTFNGTLAAASVCARSYPVDSIYISAASTNPNTSLGCGTWTAFGTGRVLVGIDAGQTEFDAALETGGAKTHTLTTAEVPSLSIGLNSLGAAGTSNTIGASESNAQDNTITTTGGGGAHNNLQPYIVVYMWRRTA